MRLSVGFKLGFWLALLGILSTGFMGYYAYQQSRGMLIASSKDKLLTATRVLAQRYTHSLHAISSDIGFITALPMLKQMASHRSDPHIWAQSREELQAIMSSLMRIHPEYLQIRLIGAADFGKELVRVDKDGSGVVIVSGADLQEKAHFPYFYKTVRLKPGEFYISNINLNREQGTHSGLGQPTLHIATPVQTGDGSIFGVIVFNVDLDYLFTYIRRDVPPDISLVLTNQDGDYLIHPVAAKEFGFDKGVRYRVQDDIPAVGEMLEREDIDDLMLDTADVGHPERDSVAAFVKIPMFSHTEQRVMLIGLLTPLESVLADSRALGINIIRITLMFSLVAIGISLLLAQYLSGPLNEMAHAVSRFAAGEPMSGLPLQRKDEIGFLAASFQSMATRLSARVNELQNHQQHLGNLAYHDQLTGLPNRLLFLDRLQQTIIKAQRNRTQFAVMFIDLDKFKEINDTMGHAAGDAVLKIAAVRMQECIRQADTLARLAGDEFTILLEDLASASDAARSAQQIIHYFAQPFVIEGKQIYLTCSIGIGIYPQDGMRAEALLQNADTAMYDAKEAGRNAFRFYAQVETER